MLSCCAMWRNSGWLYFRVLGCNFSLYLDEEQPFLCLFFFFPSPFHGCLCRSLLRASPCPPPSVQRHLCTQTQNNTFAGGYLRVSCSIHVPWELRCLGEAYGASDEAGEFLSCSWGTALETILHIKGCRQPADCINSPVLGIFWSLNA